MFDKILEKAEEAMVRLSKVLSAYDKDSDLIKVKLDEQFTVARNKFNAEIDALNRLSTEEITNRRSELDELLFKFKSDLAQIRDQHKCLLKGEVENSLRDFEKAVKDRLESLYAKYEAEALKKAEKSFEMDLSEMFQKYGDKFAPYIFKSLLKYIFKFGRK